MKNINFKKVKATEIQIRILYELLKKRKFSISNTTLPTYENHEFFVKKNPYIVWFIVYDYENPVGSVYLQKDNSIGINLMKADLETVKAIIDFIKLEFNPITEVKSKVPSYFFVDDLKTALLIELPKD